MTRVSFPSNGVGGRTPSARFLRPYDEAQIYGLGTDVLEQVHAFPLVLAPCGSLIPPQNALSARLIIPECTGSDRDRYETVVITFLVARLIHLNVISFEMGSI